VCLAGLCGGVAYGFERSSPALAVLLVCCGGASVVVRRRPHVVGLGVLCLAFGLGAIDAGARINRGVPLDRYSAGAPRCSFEITALEDEGGLGALAGVEALRCSTGPAPGGLVWVDRDVVPGGRLAGEGWLVPLGDDGFGRARRRFGAGAELVVDRARAAAPEAGPAALAHALRSGLEDATDTMERDRGGLLRGVTTGDTSALGEDTIEDFRSAGLSHLVAVSGQNVAMVLGAVAVVTGALSARARVVVGIAATGLFVLVVGPQPSVMRAAAMALIALTALGLGARADAWHLFGGALIAVIALRPAVLYSAGLHLSAAATAGLLLWAAPLVRAFERLPRWIGLGLAATLAAQLAVTPLIAGLFGSISIVAPVANVLALPAVPPATILGLCAAIAGALLDQRAGRLVAGLAEPFLAWILWVARSLGHSSWAAVDVPAWCGWPLAAVVVAVALRTAGIAPHRR
jgi:competence protein ComEC